MNENTKTNTQVDKEKEGMAEGTIEFVAPPKPGPYFAR